MSCVSHLLIKKVITGPLQTHGNLSRGLAGPLGEPVQSDPLPGFIDWSDLRSNRGHKQSGLCQRSFTAVA